MRTYMNAIPPLSPFEPAGPGRPSPPGRSPALRGGVRSSPRCALACLCLTLGLVSCGDGGSGALEGSGTGPGGDIADDGLGGFGDAGTGPGAPQDVPATLPSDYPPDSLEARMVTQTDNPDSDWVDLWQCSSSAASGWDAGYDFGRYLSTAGAIRGKGSRQNNRF